MNNIKVFNKIWKNGIPLEQCITRYSSPQKININFGGTPLYLIPLTNDFYLLESDKFSDEIPKKIQSFEDVKRLIRLFYINPEVKQIPQWVAKIA